MFAFIIGLEECILFLINRSVTVSLKRLMLLFSPFITFMLLWFIPNVEKMKSYLSIHTSNSIISTANLTTWDNYVLFYPRSLIYAYSPSTILGILMVIFLLLAILYIKNHQVRYCWLMVIINI